MCLENWSERVTSVRGEYLARVKKAHRCLEKECSSSDIWPTPTALEIQDQGTNWESLARLDKGGRILRRIATLAQKLAQKESNWPSPRASLGMNDSVEVAEKRMKNKGYEGKLEQAVAKKNWATPTSRDHKDTGENTDYEKVAKKVKLTGQVMMEEKWASPTVNGNYNRKGASEHSGDGIATQVSNVENWPTPTAAEGSKIGSQPNYGQVGLSNHPAIVGQPDRDKLKKDGKNPESPQGEKPKKNNKQLSPNWVEQLMGLPKVGWTQLSTRWRTALTD
tara:strand:- start:1388 stop:2221 length:834 start_codon:yes stop_codon:yes gene_type:complete